MVETFDILKGILFFYKEERSSILPSNYAILHDSFYYLKLNKDLFDLSYIFERRIHYYFSSELDTDISNLIMCNMLECRIKGWGDFYVICDKLSTNFKNSFKDIFKSKELCVLAEAASYLYDMIRIRRVILGIEGVEDEVF